MDRHERPKLKALVFWRNVVGATVAGVVTQALTGSFTAGVVAGCLLMLTFFVADLILKPKDGDANRR